MSVASGSSHQGKINLKYMACAHHSSVLHKWPFLLCVPWPQRAPVSLAFFWASKLVLLLPLSPPRYRTLQEHGDFEGWYRYTMKYAAVEPEKPVRYCFSVLLNAVVRCVIVSFGPLCVE